MPDTGLQRTLESQFCGQIVQSVPWLLRNVNGVSQGGVTLCARGAGALPFPGLCTELSLLLTQGKI